MFAPLLSIFAPQRCKGCGTVLPVRDLHAEQLDSKHFDLKCSTCVEAGQTTAALVAPPGVPRSRSRVTPEPASTLPLELPYG